MSDPLSPVAHPGTVHLQVRDLGASLRYYQNVLGLHVVAQSGAEATLGPRDDPRTLLRLTSRPGGVSVPRGGSLGLYHFAILVPSRAALGRFLAHIATIGQSAGLTGLSDHAVSEAIYLSDPDGLGIEIYADRPRDAWRRDARGQLHMTTMPLDAQGLIAAGNDEAWSGMPTGTVMGHVHLHVGDLEQASHFYHQALGLDRTVWEFPGALFMSAGGYHHHLGTNTWSRGGPPAPDQAQLLSWDLVLPDAAAIDASVRRLEAHDIVVTREGATALVADPWGTRLRLVQP